MAKVTGTVPAVFEMIGVLAMFSIIALALLQVPFPINTREELLSRYRFVSKISDENRRLLKGASLLLSTLFYNINFQNLSYDFTNLYSALNNDDKIGVMFMSTPVFYQNWALSDTTFYTNLCVFIITLLIVGVVFTVSNECENYHKAANGLSAKEVAEDSNELQ